MRTVLAALTLLLSCTSPASAHLALVHPPSRYGEDVLKEGPCGLRGGGRGDAATELEPGAQLRVVWNEYVDHPGHFRIAFDADGDDDFVDPVCLSDCATRTPAIALYGDPSVLLDGIADTPDGGEGSAVVTLPDVECERCTLQVIQVMYDKPPFATPGNDIYYQCADLILRRRPVACTGDCDGDGAVTVAELTLAVRIALGLDAGDACAAADRDGDGAVSIGEVVRAVGAALAGCPAAAR
ncbi:MAG: SCE4755 family polysaccharide monooxygenase-like protein [Candidatus Binatia bacterium]